ncbi:MAG: CDP-archaeol synthase [Proteobacteria bacterium]|nr:CDP-archaeol synthase [Pseudomonadota bacterium]
MSWIALSNAMILLIVANLMPWALGRMCGSRWAAPIDGGKIWRDGRRVLGPHKTWRGLAGSLLGCAGAAALLGLPWWFGVRFAGLSMLGDAISSALKRRRGREPGQDDVGLDQLPEALLPLIVSRHTLNLGWGDIILVTLVFAVLDLISLRVRKPRRRPVEADEGT